MFVWCCKSINPDSNQQTQKIICNVTSAPSVLDLWLCPKWEGVIGCLLRGGCSLIWLHAWRSHPRIYFHTQHRHPPRVLVWSVNVTYFHSSVARGSTWWRIITEEAERERAHDNACGFIMLPVSIYLRLPDDCCLYKPRICHALPCR